MHTTPWMIAIPALLCAARFCAAGTPAHAPDKGAYHLFNPTPPALMRALSTDRPDQTESAYTVDAGHYQVEMDFVNATFDRNRSGAGDVRTETWMISPLNLKMGLLNQVDVQFVLDTYVHTRVDDRTAATEDTASGFGDVQTRLKINLWGNDGGQTALAVMPFVKWPLSASSLRNGKTEGGLIIPLAVALPRDWGMGLMTEVDVVRNAANDGYDAEFLNSITFSHDIIGSLGGYVEFVAVTGNAPGFEWVGQAAAGLTWGFGDHTQLDLGCNFGVTESAPDYNPFLGLSRRF